MAWRVNSGKFRQLLYHEIRFDRRTVRHAWTRAVYLLRYQRLTHNIDPFPLLLFSDFVITSYCKRYILDTPSLPSMIT